MSKPRPVVTRIPPAEPSHKPSAHIKPSKPATTQIKEPKTEEPEGMSDLNIWVKCLENRLLLIDVLNL